MKIVDWLRPGIKVKRWILLGFMGVLFITFGALEFVNRRFYSLYFISFYVFLIISESYANWPLLPEYSNLNIANGMRNIIRQDNAAYVPAFLPNGMSTISGVMGVITGLTDANMYQASVESIRLESGSLVMGAVTGASGTWTN
jgi:hypothetical protein